MSRTPIHPGEILKEELDVICISVAEMARQLRVPEKPYFRGNSRSAQYHGRYSFAIGPLVRYIP